MKTQKLLAVYVLALLVISLPFTALHLLARPDDAVITPLQHLTAALANYFGPWGVVIVRLVDFPNAGLRSFNLFWAVALTAVAVVLVVLGARTHRGDLQVALVVCWALFATIWFGVGLTQIASGLL